MQLASKFRQNEPDLLRGVDGGADMLQFPAATASSPERTGALHSLKVSTRSAALKSRT